MQALLVVCLCARWPLFADNFLVLPFFNLSGDSNLEWIGESLSETVREALASEGVIALDREDRQEAYRRLSIRPHTQLTKATVLRIGEFLDADKIVYGTFNFTPPADGNVPRTRGALHIVAQILNLRKAARGPEYVETGSLEDLAQLQTHLAWQTIRMVVPDSAPSEEEFRSRRPAIRVGAIEHYTRGLLTSSPDQKLQLFSQAVRIDPDLSQASFQIGRLYYRQGSWRLAGDHFQRVADWDVRYREATFLLGLCFYHLSDFDKAEEAFRGVAEAVPLNEVWNNLAAAQARLNSDQALANFERALEGDPADHDYHFNVGYTLFRMGELEKAADKFRAVLDRDPDDAEATTMLGRCLRKGVQRSGTAPSEGLERIKETFEESAWLQLKAVLEQKR